MKERIVFIAFAIVFCTSVTFAYDWATNPGDGSKENPYQISEPNQLIAIGSDSVLLTKHFILTQDIIFDPNHNPAHVFTTAVITPDTVTGPPFNGAAFTGSLDGKGHRVCNLTINGAGYLGLFGSIGPGGSVRNLRLETVQITGTGKNLGGLCSILSGGTLQNCSVKGSIHGTNSGGLGGLCGIVYDGTIRNCCSTGSVTCAGNTGGDTGGLYGWILDGLIMNNYANCSVKGNYGVGALCGGSSGGVNINCYASGPASSQAGLVYAGGLCGYLRGGSFINCYFLESAGPDNGIGDPLTDTEMKQRVNFIMWDFVDDGSDGPNNIWRMCEDGADYPRLSWEFGQAGDYACPDEVGMDDLQALAIAWLTTDNTYNFNYAVDGSGDGRINQQDMAILSSYWQE